MKNIVVIGAGTMGNGIAHTFAQCGFKVQLIDVSQTALDKGLSTISKNLDRMVAKEKILVSAKEATLNNITAATTIESIDAADLVIEAAAENLDLKLSIFKQLDKVCPKHTILATNTSSISISEIANATTRPEQVIGMHFMNPVPLMQLVEVIKGKQTSNATTDVIINLSKTLDKIPVKVNDFPGFITNRILMPMLNEAIEALETGVAGVDEIDTIMKLGMSHPMGPLQLADYIGLDVCLSILNVLHKGFNNSKYAPTKLLVKMVNEGRLGIKSGEGFYDYSESKKAEIVAQAFL